MITDYTKLPTLLQSRKHWVLCGVPGAADPKHPRQAKHPQWGADSTNPATWADFATASAAVMLDDADGMGYVFAKDDGLVFIDGDHCLGADGRPLPPFNKWLTMLPGYCERSRSGTGLHFIVRGTLPDGCKHKKHINGGEMAVELYDCNRYVALTGDLWGEQTPLEDAPSAQAGIDVILQQMGMLADDGPADALPDQPDRPEEEIQAIIADALQRDGDFAQLWSCTEHPGKLGDESKDDIAFCTAAWRATSYQLSAGDLMHGLDASPWAETKDNTAPKWHWDKWHGTGHRSTGDYRKNTALRAYQKAKRQEAAALEGFKSLAPGALPGEVLQLKLSDLSEVEEGTKFADNVVGGLLYNASLGWLAWDGCRFAPDECRTRLLAQLFTERQLKAAAADLQQAAGAAAQDAENTELAAQAKRAKEVYLRDTAGERKDYAEVLFTQAGGAVLSWMVEGARRFIANGYKLTPPAVVREALADYRKSCDWLGGFLTECCELGENYATNGRELYARYTAYCQVNGDYRRDNRDFAHAMQNAGYERKHTMKGWQYYGLRLHSELPQE